MDESKRDFQGIWIPRMVYLHPGLNWYAKILFLEIHSFTENGKECFMSNEYISDFLGISKRQVTRYITDLKDLGWIEEVGFDGRKRFLRSRLQYTFRLIQPAMTNMTTEPRQKRPSRRDETVYHNKQRTKQGTNKITSLKKNDKTRGTTLD